MSMYGDSKYNNQKNNLYNEIKIVFRRSSNFRIDSNNS